VAGLHILLAAHCYGGVASTGFARSLLALEAACMAQGLRLQTSLGGGEALVSRARAGMLAGFLESSAARLVLLDGDLVFDPEELLGLVRAGKDVVGRAADAAPGLHTVEAVAPGLLVVTRQAAERMAAGYPQLKGGMRDVRGVGVASAPMVFDGFVDAATRRYVADMDAFCARWRALGGEVWAVGGELRGR